MNNIASLHPKTRGLATLLFAAGLFLCSDPMLLLPFWLAAFAVLALMGFWKPHGKYLIAVILPIYAALLLIWGMVVPPSVADAGQIGDITGYQYATTIALRLAGLGAIIQLCFLPLMKRNGLITTLREWGLRGTPLTITLSTLALIEDINYRVRQVMEARIARGMSPHGLINDIKQLPVVLRPLFVFILHSAIKRAELWHHRNLRHCLENSREAREPVSRGLSLITVGLAIFWVGLNVHL